MKSRFKSKQFTEAVREKMFTDMAKRKQRIGLREFAKKIDISAATLSRVEHGNIPDLETFFKLCSWMDRSPSIFYDGHYNIQWTVNTKPNK